MIALTKEERAALVWLRQTMRDSGLTPPIFADEMRATLRPLLDRLIAEPVAVERRSTPEPFFFPDGPNGDP